jgi:hypothetical protein
VQVRSTVLQRHAERQRGSFRPDSWAIPRRFARTMKSSIRQSRGLFRIRARILAAFGIRFDDTTGGTTQLASRFLGSHAAEVRVPGDHRSGEGWIQRRRSGFLVSPSPERFEPFQGKGVGLPVSHTRATSHFLNELWRVSERSRLQFHQRRVKVHQVPLRGLQQHA